MGAGDLEELRQPVPRLNYRVAQVCALAGCSRWKVTKKMKTGEIRWRRDGRDIYLHPGDVERVFGFPDEDHAEMPSPVALDILTRLRE